MGSPTPGDQPPYSHHQPLAPSRGPTCRFAGMCRPQSPTSSPCRGRGRTCYQGASGVDPCSRWWGSRAICLWSSWDTVTTPGRAERTSPDHTDAGLNPSTGCPPPSQASHFTSQSLSFPICWTVWGCQALQAATKISGDKACRQLLVSGWKCLVRWEWGRVTATEVIPLDEGNWAPGSSHPHGTSELGHPSPSRQQREHWTNRAFPPVGVG